MCYGNICRSPYLEARLRASLPDFTIVSAGMVGPGRPVPEHGLAVAMRRGLDLASHRSQLAIPGLAAESQLVIVMDVRQRHYLTNAFGIPGDRIVLAGDLDPLFENGRVIRDPWQQPVEVFEASYTRLDRCAAVLTELLRVVA